MPVFLQASTLLLVVGLVDHIAPEDPDPGRGHAALNG